MKFNGKKFFLIGFILVLLVGIPATIYILQQQQQTSTKAAKATKLTFTPTSSQQTPIEKKVGDPISLNIKVDPSTNMVSFVKLIINYDADKLATASSNAFVPNISVFPKVAEGPIYAPGVISVSLSVGSDPTKAIQSAVNAATVNFVAKANTTDQPTRVTYDISEKATEVLSIASTDEAGEDVLSSADPAYITIGEGTEPTGSITETPVPVPSLSETPTPLLTETPTPAATDTPMPTETGTPSPSGEPTETGIPSDTLTPAPTSTSSANVVPSCSNLAVDRATTGIAPFSITFTVNGTDSDGTISKANFNYGDGAISGDVTTSGGLGTNTVNVAQSHTYNNAGTYTATAVLTDNNGGVSTTDTCRQTIYVQNASGGGSEAPAATLRPTSTMAPTGTTETVLGIGAAILLLTIGGGLIFFIL